MGRTFYFEELISKGVNPYEAVILAAKESRRLNRARLNADLPDGAEKITTVSLYRIIDGNIEMADREQGDPVGGAEPEEDSAGS